MRFRNSRKCWHAPLLRLAVCALAVTVAGCADSPATPTLPSSGLAPDGATLARAAKVSVCHRTGSDSYRLLTINGNALSAHLAHGDATPGAAVPDGTGATLDQDCVPQTVSVAGTYTLRTLGGETLPTLGNGELVLALTIVLDEDGNCSLSGRARRAQEDPDGEIEEFTTPSCSYSLEGTALTLVLFLDEGEETIPAELVGDQITLQIPIWDDGDGSAEEDAELGDAVFVKV